MTERWLPVPGYEALYEVSDEGRVRSLRRGIILRPSYSNSGGYPMVILSYRGKRQGLYVHQLVLLTFAGPGSAGDECRHIDGDPRNCTLDNLAWGSSSANKFDQVTHGTHYEASRTACDAGHEYAEANTYIDPNTGGRVCRACRNRRVQEWNARNAASGRQCSETGCVKPPIAKGLCRNHYTSQWRQNRT